tara:strand:- start:1236 stop:1961 length:726 start_codon:yes stop_codon:yes gene_type:complete
MELGAVVKQEYECFNTSKTKNPMLEQFGFFKYANLVDPKILYHSVPKERGVFKWWGKKLDEFNHIQEKDTQVSGAVSRYHHPQYIKAHTEIRKVLERALSRKLYNTYYYDRFYFPGQTLVKHVDRPACEISVSVHVSTNLKELWPIWVKAPDEYEDEDRKILKKVGEDVPVFLEPGDGLVYKGCERPHWREPMPGMTETALNITHNQQKEELYYHQIFFHYVLQDGQRAEHAYDAIGSAYT